MNRRDGWDHRIGSDKITFNHMASSNSVKVVARAPEPERSVLIVCAASKWQIPLMAFHATVHIGRRLLCCAIVPMSQNKKVCTAFTCFSCFFTVLQGRSGDAHVNILPDVNPTMVTDNFQVALAVNEIRVLP